LDQRRNMSQEGNPRSSVALLTAPATPHRRPRQCPLVRFQHGLRTHQHRDRDHAPTRKYRRRLGPPDRTHVVLSAVRQRSSSSTVLPVIASARHHTVQIIERVLSVIGRLGGPFPPILPRHDVELRTFCFLLLTLSTHPSTGASARHIPTSWVGLS
jgi:hypothetical protein